MMRWNSTKTYTEDDILRMQQEAVSRVHDFQSRAQSFYDVPESAIMRYDSGGAPLYARAAPVIEAKATEISAPETGPEPPASASDPTHDGFTPVEPLAGNGGPAMQGPPIQEPWQEPVQENAPTRENAMRENIPAPVQQPHKPTDPISGLLENFHLDGETLLILGLMFLLYNEKADHVLLMALGYLLL